MDADYSEIAGQEATLASVAQHDFRLPPHAPASLMYAEFQRDPLLPGVIVARGDEAVGVLSRDRFFQLLSHRYGAPLFLDAPLQKMLDASPHDHLVLPESMSIHNAASAASRGRAISCFEPVVVVAEGRPPRLLGMHELLLAQLRQLTLAYHTIQQQIDAVEAASRAKGIFLANMSHEIRTPLNAVVGMTELLLDGSLTPRQREYAETAIGSCENLLAIINDVLDFSKIESGRLDLERIGFDVREHLGDTLKGLAVRAFAQGIELAWRCAADVPHEVVGDPVRLRQVLLNLVGNAIKFTREGEVVVNVALESGDAAGVVLHYCVTDTGVGIPSDKLGAIFDAFEQADTSTTRQFGGTGLGLAISQRLVRLMQGELWVHSQIGRGSQFHFSARFGTAAAARPAADIARAAGRRVLVVEAKPTTRSILCELLRSWQMETVAISAAAAALDQLSAAAGPGCRSTWRSSTRNGPAAAASICSTPCAAIACWAACPSWRWWPPIAKPPLGPIGWIRPSV